MLHSLLSKIFFGAIISFSLIFSNSTFAYLPVFGSGNEGPKAGPSGARPTLVGKVGVSEGVITKQGNGLRNAPVGLLILKIVVRDIGLTQLKCGKMGMKVGAAPVKK